MSVVLFVFVGLMIVMVWLVLIVKEILWMFCVVLVKLKEMLWNLILLVIFLRFFVLIDFLCL